MPSGILSYGLYIPRRRLQRASIHDTNKWFAPGLAGMAKGEKAIGNWDEDSVTMAVEAGRYCMDGIERSSITSVSLASTTLPFVDRSNAGIVKEALNLSDNVSSHDRTGSLRAATSLLMQSLQGDDLELCLAADRRKAKVASVEEMNYGDAAAGFLTGAGNVIAKYLGGRSKTIDFVDHYRETGADFDYAWEARFVRDEGYQKILGSTIVDALRELAISGEEIDHAVIAVPVKAVPQKLAKVAGIAPDAVADISMATIGDTGVTHPLLMLAMTLQHAKPGEKVLLASFGQGADVLVFETTEQLQAVNERQASYLQSGLADSNYARYLFHRGMLEIDKGMRAELDEKQPGTSLSRDRKTVLGLIGGRCSQTGVVQFPKTDLAVNTESRISGTLEDYPLADRVAKVLSFTADRLAYSPDPPGYYGMIDFEGGGRMTAEFADIEEDEVEVGTQMRMVFRIKSFDELRGFRKYFWKAIPIRRGDC